MDLLCALASLRSSGEKARLFTQVACPLSWKRRLLVAGFQMRMVLSQDPDA